MIKQRIKNILIALDQFAFSIITLGNASPDETISAAAYRMELEGKWQGKLLRPIIDKLLFFDYEHCKNSFRSEVNRTQLGNNYKNFKGEG